MRIGNLLVRKNIKHDLLTTNQPTSTKLDGFGNSKSKSFGHSKEV